MQIIINRYILRGGGFNREYIKNTIYHNVNYDSLIVVIYRADFELIFVVF